MDSFTRGSLTFVVYMAISVSVVTGLQCYSCSYVKLQTSNETVNKALASYLSKSSEECKGSVNKDSKGVVLQNCPAPGTGKKSFCGKVDLTMEMSSLSINVKLDAVTRLCVEEASYKKDGCEMPTEDDKSRISEQFGSSFTISALDGTSCTCSGELCNGQEKVTAETLCWLAGLLLAFCAHQLW